jgi:CRP-like cAMP-binding protein
VSILRSKNAKIELLKSVSLFATCTKPELAHAASLFDEVEVREGYVLTKEGEPGREFFVVVDGRARVTLRGKKLDTLGPGAFFGEMALLEREPRAATVTAETPMKLLVLTAAAFATFVHEVPAAALNILRGMAQRLRAIEKGPRY